MNYLTRQSGALFAAAAVALGGLTLSANGAEEDAQAPRGDIESHQMNESDTVQGETLKGKVVNLQQFLTAGAASGTYADKPSTSHAVSKDAPLGLHVENDGLIGALTSEKTYLIVFDPNNDTQSDAYKDARNLIGKDVAVTGKVLERGSLSGVLISKIERATPEQAAAETRQQ